MNGSEIMVCVFDSLWLLSCSQYLQTRTNFMLLAMTVLAMMLLCTLCTFWHKDIMLQLTLLGAAQPLSSLSIFICILHSRLQFATNVIFAGDSSSSCSYLFFYFWHLVMRSCRPKGGRVAKARSVMIGHDHIRFTNQIPIQESFRHIGRRW